jgi:hypothetical protein
VPYSGPPAARGHLRLAGPPADRRPTVESRAVLLLRAVLAALSLAFLTLLAWFAAALALVPLAWRRAPMGVRLRPLRPREARVIPFERARQKASSR